MAGTSVSASDLRQTEPLDQRALPRPPLHVAHERATSASRGTVRKPSTGSTSRARGEAHVAAERDHVGRLGETAAPVAISSTTLSMWRVSRRMPLLVRTVPRGQPLPQADRAERDRSPDCIGLPALEAREVRAAAAHFDEQRRARLQRRRDCGQPLADGEIRQAALLRSVDDVERDAGPDAHAVEEGVGVGGLADRAGRDGTHAHHAVVVHDAAERVQRPYGRVDGRRTDASRCERVASQQHAARGLLQHLRTLAGQVLRDDQPHRRRADVDGGHDGGRGRQTHGLWPRGDGGRGRVRHRRVGAWSNREMR